MRGAPITGAAYHLREKTDLNCVLAVAMVLPRTVAIEANVPPRAMPSVILASAGVKPKSEHRASLLGRVGFSTFSRLISARAAARFSGLLFKALWGDPPWGVNQLAKK